MDHIRALLLDPVQKRHLQLELAAVIDIGQHFVRATYDLEGDGPLIFSTFRKPQEVLTACSLQHYPNISTVAKQLVEEDPELDLQELKQWAKNRIRPGVLWFMQQFNVKHRAVVDMFKYAQYFSPIQVQALKPDATDIEHLRQLPFLNDNNMIIHLQQELPAYLAAVSDVEKLTDEEIVGWWMSQEDELPFWSKSVKKFFCYNHCQLRPSAFSHY